MSLGLFVGCTFQVYDVGDVVRVKTFEMGDGVGEGVQGSWSVIGFEEIEDACS